MLCSSIGELDVASEDFKASFLEENEFRSAYQEGRPELRQRLIDGAKTFLEKIYPFLKNQKQKQKQKTK
jgi:hypothetical protein